MLLGQYPGGVAYGAVKGEIFVAIGGVNTVSVLSDSSTSTSSSPTASATHDPNTHLSGFGAVDWLIVGIVIIIILLLILVGFSRRKKKA